MKPIQTWKHSEETILQKIHLYKNKIMFVDVFDEDDVYEEEYSFQEFFALKLPLISVEIDLEISKRIVEQKKPTNLEENENKKWDFWEAFDNSNIEEEKMVFDDKKFWHKSKDGFAEGHINYDDKIILYSWQAIDDFFFYGPKFHAVTLENRLRIRQEIFDCLDKTKSNFTIEDSFDIFDYDKIEKIDYEKRDGITGNYFRIENGIVTIGGWDNPRDGGEYYLSVENLWYNLDVEVPKQFKDKIQNIKSILSQAIINQKAGESNFQNEDSLSKA